MDSRIIEYYKLCSLRSDPVISPIKNIDEKIIKTTFTSNQIELFLRKTDHGYSVRENVIGAGKKTETHEILIL